MGRTVILDLLYPRRCPFCGQVQAYQGNRVCEGCMKKVKRVTAPHCMKCGKTVEADTEEFCRDCSAIPKSFDRGFPVFFYEEPVKSALYDLKYKNQREYAVFFADCMAAAYGRRWQELQLDAIIPIPVHPHKLRKRGYNQAELLAKELSKRLSVPVERKGLIRIVDTNPQKELNDKARMKNLKNAFQSGGNAIKFKKVLLVDDIYTSGATMEACTRVLKGAGVEYVYCTSVAIGKGYSG